MISERLKEYFEHKDISYYEVEKTIEVSTGCISGAVRHKRNIGSNILHKILLAYEDLSAEWLFRGTGEMLLDNDGFVDRKVTKYDSLTDNWLIDRMLTFFNLRSKNELIGYFERISTRIEPSAEQANNQSPFEMRVLEIVESKYGSTLSNAEELYAMYLQKLMREGEEMLNNDGDDQLGKKSG